ncbi:MAG: hypothetical protein JW384_03633 [Nitrosomonadaceae bacterium]|nr:hypothetical protein [Nitrosomonadaceae bacterium]
MCDRFLLWMEKKHLSELDEFSLKPLYKGPGENRVSFVHGGGHPHSLGLATPGSHKGTRGAVLIDDNFFGSTILVEH